MSLADATLRTARDTDQVDRLLARDVTAACIARLREAPTVHLAVSGGSVADRALPSIVAAATAAGIDWGAVHIWFADERYVIRGHEDRNAGAVMAALRQAPGFFASQLHIPAASDSGLSLDEAAAEYQRDIQRIVPTGPDRVLPVFDAVVLGMGPDGHTASLFPGSEGLETTEALVAPVRQSPKPPPERVTLTLPVLRSAALVFVYATGAGKREALALARRGTASASESPVGALDARVGLQLYADAAALGTDTADG